MTVYKRITLIVLIFIFAISCCGCSGPWRRKFVRKKKVEVKEEPVFHPEEYGKEFTTQQLYANHFAFWRAAELEFISCLKACKAVNRLRTYTSYAMVELKRLHDLLIEEKQKELKPFIEELKEIMVRINQPNYVDSHRNFLVSISDKHYRTVSRRFSYYSMRNYIRLEEESGELTESKKPEEPEEPEIVPAESEVEAEKQEELEKPEVEPSELEVEADKPEEIENQDEPKTE